MTETTPLSARERKLFDLVTGGSESLALLRAVRKSDRREVALVTLVDRDGDEFIIAPLAEIIPLKANIHDLYEDPTT